MIEARNAQGKIVEPVVGMWYVFVEIRDDAPMIPAANWHWGQGEIAQYVGDGEFYDDGCDEPVRTDRYDYVVESHMGKLA